MSSIVGRWEGRHSVDRHATRGTLNNNRLFFSALSFFGNAGFAQSGIPMCFGETHVLGICGIAFASEYGDREPGCSAQDFGSFLRGPRGVASVAISSGKEVRDVEVVAASTGGFLACRNGL